MVPGPEDGIFSTEKTLEGSVSKVELPPLRGAGYEPSALSGEPTGVASILVSPVASNFSWLLLNYCFGVCVQIIWYRLVLEQSTSITANSSPSKLQPRKQIPTKKMCVTPTSIAKRVTMSPANT